MSTRQLLNLTMGAFALLLLAALGIVFSTLGSQSEQDARIDLAVNQQVLIQNLTRQAGVLAAAEDRDSVATARRNMARTIVQFDRNLASLLHGGEFVDESGNTVIVTRTGNDSARRALEEGAQLWLQNGRPLADLAAGEFSVFSAAGQKAVTGLQNSNVGLMQAMGTAANALRVGQQARATIAGIARWAAAGLALVLIGLTAFRRRLLGSEAAARTVAKQPTAAPATEASAPRDPVRPFARAAGSSHSADKVPSSTAPVDFDSVSASVDQMSVDMNTIAGSTEKMRQAIDSVGHALQGMLYSLNEMAQDTAEGHRIVRNANNAASFTATAAGDLAASAREMSSVVARVTQLAQKTKQVAAQIDGDAALTGKTGATFTSVVAGEVHGLARQTNLATHEIDNTVAEIMTTARQYEEAIGQIIKNVNAINKVSENLGKLMLSPPPRVEPATQGAPASTLTPAGAPAAVAAEPAPAVPAAPEVTEPAAVAIPDDPVEPEATVAATAAETAAAISEAASDSAPAADSGSASTADPTDNDSIFMLGGNSKSPKALNIPAVPVPEAAAPATPVDEPAAEDRPQPADDNDEDVGLEVFMLNKPENTPEAATRSEKEPAPESGVTEDEDDPVIGKSDEKEPEREAVPAADEPAIGEEGSNANIFMLNKPK